MTHPIRDPQELLNRVEGVKDQSEPFDKATVKSRSADIRDDEDIFALGAGSRGDLAHHHQGG
jgi:hypothetical protein